MLRTVRTAALVILCSGAALCACTAKTGSAQPTVSQANLQQGVADSLQQSVGQRPDSVNCPGPITATVGQTERCTLTASGTTFGLTVKITGYSNGQATYDVQVDHQPMSAAPSP
jgi:uncharacterized protein DUF4333